MRQIKHLLPCVPQYFKANLHTHSTVSDGKLSPQEVKDLYKSLGYHILAITDHNIIADHSAMNEPDFLMLTGVEINHNHESYRPRFDGPVYHLNLIAKRPDNLWSPGKAPHKYPGGLAYEELVDYEEMDMSYDVNAVNAMIAKANEKGFLVFYNHPTWSCQSYPDYAPLKGLWGMELRNSECYIQGNDDNNPRVFKDLLNLGNRLYPLGTDDMHMIRAAGLSWISVGAKELTYDTVIKALEDGDFYMSCGPEIKELTIENNMLRIACSPASRINLESHGRFARSVRAEKGETLNGAEFDLSVFFEKAQGDPDMFIRLTVYGTDGTYAATRAYFLNELLP